jgi:uncharacterized membrane protein YfcA
MIMAMLFHGAVYAFIGVFAGLMAGILGVGGGIIVVPGLVFIFQLTHFIPENIIMHAAAGTSLAVMIFTSFASLGAHFRLGEILWPVFKKLWSGIVIGVVVGAVIAEFIPTHWLKIIFSLFLFFVAFKMCSDLQVIHSERFPKTWVTRVVSFLIGLKSGLLGVGGGLLIIPYLTYCGMEVRKIAAVSNLCTFTVGLSGAIVFMITGRNEMAAIPYASGYVYWPAVLWVAIPSSLIAPFGAKLNYFLPIKQLKYIFIVILLLTAIKMLF